MSENQKPPAPTPAPRQWRPGWSQPGEVVRFAGKHYLCLRETAGQPSTRERAAHIWRPLD